MIKNESGVVLTRKELYDLLSDSDIIPISEKLGVDVESLKHAVVDNRIPCRTREDWCEIVNGKAVSRVPLFGDPDLLVVIPYTYSGTNEDHVFEQEEKNIQYDSKNEDLANKRPVKVDEKQYVFDIVGHFGVLSKSRRGWKKELTKVSWGGREPVYDIRDWSADYTKMSKGTTFTLEELKNLHDILCDFFALK